MNHRKTLLFITTFLVVLLLIAGVAAAAVPKRVLIVVMDQMKPGYAQKYNMTNVLWLQNQGVTFPNAFVGDMGAETVVSHNVMVSGLLPKHMGWADEMTRDVNNTLGFGANNMVEVGDLGYSDFVKLITAAGDYPKLGDYLHARFPGTIVANVGEKAYQVQSMAALSSDYWVNFSGKYKQSDTTSPFYPVNLPWTGKYRGPDGNMPGYIKNDPRFLVSSGNYFDDSNPWDYYKTQLTSPAWVYYDDGRYVAGPYSGHQSGDRWVCDAALKIMDHEKWSGLFVTFSAIDKVGHMWGGGTTDNYTGDPNSLYAQVHMPWAAKNADDQLGRLIKKLKDKGIFGETLIVVTADHAVTAGTNGWYCKDEQDGATYDGWYSGSYFPGPSLGVPYTYDPASVHALQQTGLVQFSYSSNSIQTWLNPGTTALDKLKVADVMLTLPGTIAAFVKDGDHYDLASTNSMTNDEKTWFDAHAQELVGSMASAGSCDVVGLLGDGVSYGAFGDHGGAQQEGQRIPYVFFMPSLKHQVRAESARLVDLMPTILRSMSITPTSPVDGNAYLLKQK
jgi:hypothetical protein